MDSRNLWLLALSGNAPFFVLWLIGAGVCFYFWRQHRLPAKLALIAITIRALQHIAGAYINAVWLPQQAQQGGLSGTGRTLSAIALGQSLVEALVFAILLVAVFAWRAARVR